MLAHKVLPLIKSSIGRMKFNQVIWQQDGVKPHQAHIYMDWLDGIFGIRMLALKARQVYFWSQASPDINPCDFFLWVVMKDKAYKPMPFTTDQLKEKISDVFNKIPEKVVKKTVFSLKTRTAKMVAVEGKGRESKII